MSGTLAQPEAGEFHVGWCDTIPQLQVANHGTDHHTQLLRLLNDLGVKTTSQDYIFYVYDNSLFFKRLGALAKGVEG
jgi:hypothetical protein